MGKRQFEPSKLADWQVDDARHLAKLIDASPQKQREIAEAAQLDASHLSQMKNGHRPLNVDAVVGLASALHVDPAEISPRLAAEIDEIARKSRVGAPDPARPVRIFRHWVSERGADLAAEWEQLDGALKDSFETLITWANASRARARPFPLADVLVALSKNVPEGAALETGASAQPVPRGSADKNL